MAEVEPARTGIDHSRHFIAEEFTPLYHTSAYALLPAAARLRYNQLHALYFNEQVAFFEQAMLSPALNVLMVEALPPHLLSGLHDFFREEQQHTAMFRELNRQAAPEIYRDRHAWFIRVANPWRSLLGVIARRPRLFPLLIWLALLQEERSLFYSRGCLKSAAPIEDHFVDAHRRHITDEAGHIRWDEELLDWLWPRTGHAIRWMNARLLAWMTREFFLAPKRSGLRVVQQLIREFPELDARQLVSAMRALETDRVYQRTLYSREITPRSFARFDRHPEFALLAQVLPGYVPSHLPL
jgi:hypothetical protein